MLRGGVSVAQITRRYQRGVDQAFRIVLAFCCQREDAYARADSGDVEA